MRIRVLGPLAVAEDGVALAPRDRVVLAALVIGHPETVSADTLTDALWLGEEPPASSAKVVQGCIVRIRKALGATAVQTDGKGYRLAVPPDDIDARRFERQLARARELLTLAQADRAMFAVEEAMSLWRTRALPEVDNWEPGRIEAVRLAELRLEAEELRIEAALRAGRYREVLADATAAVKHAPLREHRWALLALAQHQAGRQGDALRTLHEARRVLVRELGIDPGDEIVAVEGAILRQEPSLLAGHPAESNAACPFRGLAHYDVADADSYFGRRSEIAQCLERLQTTGVLAVVGPSGSGKSSLLRAGLAPALEHGGQRVEVITPGSHPMDALAALATHRQSPFALVVDQCEEAITMCTDVEERAGFFDQLVAHAASAPLLVGLRADRLGDLTEHAAFAAVVERGLYLLKPMTPEQLREAIEAPARQAGLLLEAGLVDLLIRDVENEPGSLPLLSHALYQTWQAREGSTLTVDGYRASGGIRGAVAQSAEHVYERVSPDRRPMLRNLMLRLVSPSPDGEPVRTRVPRRIVAPDTDRSLLVDDLVKARLLTTDAQDDAASVELAHEAVARAWPRLREWLDDDVEGLRMSRHLAAAAENWQMMDRPESELYRGVRLARVTEWAARSAPDLHATEHEFLDASARLAEAERAASDEQARRQRRANRRLRMLVACAATLAIAAAAVGVVAMRQADRADREARIARSHELSTAAIGALADDPALAKLLAVAAADVDDSSLAAAAALQQSLAADPTVARWGFVGEVGVLAADVNEAGDRIAAAGMFQPDGAGWKLEVADPFTGQVAWSFDLSRSREASAFVVEPTFTADDRYVVAGTYWDPYSWRRVPIAFDGVDEPVADLLGAHVFDAATGELVDRIDLGRCGGAVSGVSETHVLARTLHGPADVLHECRWLDGTIGVELIDRRTGERRVLTTATDAPWHLGAAMSGDGARVAFDDGATGEVVVVDVASGDELLRAPGNGVRDLGSRGDRVLVGWFTVEVWDVSTGRATASVVLPNGPTNDSRFGPDGGSVFSSAGDGVVREWDAVGGEELAAYPALGQGPVSMNAAGRLVVTIPDQQIATVIDTDRHGQLGGVTLCDGSVVDTLAVSGSLAVVRATCDGAPAARTFTVDVSTWEVDRESGRLTVGGLAPSPDGALLAEQHTVERDDGSLTSGPVTVYDLRTGVERVELEPLPGTDEWPFVARLRWSPDGRWITGALGAHLVVWDAESGRLTHSAVFEDAVVVDVIFVPDSAAVIATSDDRRISRRRLDAWEDEVSQGLTFDGAYDVGLVGFVGDGTTLLAVGGYQSGSGALAWLDADTFVLDHQLPTPHDGAVTSATLSDEGSVLATGSSDGTARVWDAATGNLVHDTGQRDTAVHAVAFAGDELVVATDGELERITIDVDRLVGMARASLTRGLTETDCNRFNFGDDCPTLDELRDRPADSGVPHGTFRLARSVDDIASTTVAAASGHYGAPVWDGVAADIAESFAQDFAGVYTLRLDGARFDLLKNGRDQPVCAGSVRVGGSRMSLRADRGSLCYPSVLFEAEFVLTDDELRLDRNGFRGEFPWFVLFATSPLERIT